MAGLAERDLLGDLLRRHGDAIDAPRWLLTPADENVLEHIQRRPTAPLPHDHVVLIMKATRKCNLRCTYCHAWRATAAPMSFETMAAATWDTLAAPNVRHVDFVWHGGEVTLLDPDYFEKAITLQRLFKRSSQRVTNSLQTNATLITDEWCALWRKFEFSVGVSIDGLPHVHDTKRIDRRGAGTWDRVVAGLAMLRDHQIPHGALTVLCEATIAADPRLFLDHIATLGVDGVALLNAVPQTSGELTAKDEWLRFDRFTEYLVALYGAWDQDYRHLFGIREFISLENNLTRPRPIICVHAARCVGQFLTVEPDGDVGPCDKFVGDPRFRFGNLREQTCAEILQASQNFETLRREEAELKSAMQTCTHAAICSGGCVHDALIKRLYESEGQSACCGLSPLIETIAARYGGKNGA